MRRAFALLTLLAACKSPPVPSTFGVNVTVEAGSLPSSVRSQIVSASLSVTGDESYSRTFDIKSAIGKGDVRFRYIPGIQSGSISLALDALSSDGTVVASAPAVTVDITAGHASSATLLLGGTTDDDMGTTMGDGGDNTCEPGTHSCDGTCVDDRSVDHCAMSCTACPVTANASAATCDGTTCGLQCNNGFHLCDGSCVDSTNANSCNMSCTPCTPPTGGTATCDGTSCNGSCPSGQKLCFGMCIPTGMACNGSCPGGTHECNGNCFDNASVNSCGTSCTPCPVPPNATMATCSNGTCGFVCNSGYKQCGSTCIPSTGCCMNSDCAQPSNGVATCDTSSNTCVIACNTNYTKCGTDCISLSACCVNSDCTPPTNGTASCNSSHTCVPACNAPYNAVCGANCVDTTTDVNNCGGCEMACAGTCAISRCVVTLASGQSNLERLAVDSTNVYWLNQASGGCNGALMKAPIAGGTAAPLVSSIGTQGYLAIDSSAVYFDDSICSNGSVVVRSVPKAGGTPATLATSTSTFAATGLAVDTGSVYFSQQGFMGTAGEVWVVPKAGGTFTSLATGMAPGSLSVDSTNLYWADASSGGLFKTPVVGGGSTKISNDLINTIDSTATDGTNVFWSTSTGSNDHVVQLAVAGGTQTPLAQGLSYPRGVIVDGGFVYWNNPLQNTIVRVPVGGGTVTTIVTGYAAVALAVDSTSLYWTVGGSAGKVMKATPK